MSVAAGNIYTQVFTTDWDLAGVASGSIQDVSRLMDWKENENNSLACSYVGARLNSGGRWIAVLEQLSDQPWGDQLVFTVFFSTEGGSTTIMSSAVIVLVSAKLFTVSETGTEVNICHVPWRKSCISKYHGNANVSFSRLRDRAGRNGNVKLRVKIEMKFEDNPTRGSELLRSIFWCRYMSDFVIEVENVSIPVHRAILGQKSTVFRTMFESPQWTETSSGVLRIEGFPKDAVIALVESFYEVPLSFDSDDQEELASSLLALSEMYDQPDLKKQCETSLEGMVSLENVCHLVVHADLHRAESLKAKCIQFAIANSRRLWSMPAWNDLRENNPRIAWEIARGGMER